MIAKKLVLKTLEKIEYGFLEVVCPDATHSFGNPGASLKAILAVHNERFFHRALFGGDIGMGESYMDGDWSSPDLVAVVRLAVRNLNTLEGESTLLSALSRVSDMLFHRRNKNTLRGSRRNIGYHYDLGNDFYQIFLDENMAYSCAYYESPEDSLEDAQIQKFDRICRKLQLTPADHVLEIGTGWGGFAVYAATQYGCRITTTTISRQQFEYAAGWFAELGLDREVAGQPKQVELLFEDYRRLHGAFDKIVSIEMFEAVGFQYYDDFFRAIDRLLKPSGTMLLQTITINEQTFKSYLKRCDWIQKYIFPGAELASITEMLRSLARCTRMSLFHAEDIGSHYAQTLKTWRRRFMESVRDVRACGFDERFIRMWDYYFASCEAAFRERHIGDFQLLLTKNLNSKPLMDEPWTDEQSSGISLGATWSE
jgi:cyclopropane-fatty-acyl-phospholipid synthase